MGDPGSVRGADGGRADPFLPRVFSVRARRQDTADTFTVELAADDGGGLAFAPGQFNMLYGFGRGESAISISGDAAQPQRLVHTVRAVGSVTRALAALTPGARLGVRGPYGTAWPLATARGRD
ncbi:MAG: Ni/Fe hydrogenase subunit gamma, partial [Gammaproteobacteria bacterium]